MLIRTGIAIAALAAGVVGFVALPPQAQSTEVAQASAWEVDTVHSSMIFRIKHNGVAWFYGRFNELTGTLNFDEADPSASSLNLEVKTESVNSGNTRRDGHLKSPDFFNASQFPASTFVSTSFAPAGENQYDVAGDLTINGVTRPITIKLEKTGEGAARNNKIVGFHTVFTINRGDFGITYGQGSLGEEVQLTVAIEAVQK